MLVSVLIDMRGGKGYCATVSVCKINSLNSTLIKRNAMKYALHPLYESGFIHLLYSKARIKIRSPSLLDHSSSSFYGNGQSIIKKKAA